jgi:uncharacterized membrane protein
MNEFLPTSPLASISFEYLSPMRALGLFALLALPFVLLGIRSLAGLGPVRRWVALGVRLLVLLLVVLILAGVRFERKNVDVEVLLLRDVSESMQLVRLPPGETLERQIDAFLTEATKPERGKRPADRIGVISFDGRASVDSIPSATLRPQARVLREPGEGTNVAAAIQLALATLSRDALPRLVLVWDGNATAGDLDAAISAAAAARVPIDVLPLQYDVRDEVLVERFVAPAWKRENEPFTIEVILRSTNVGDVSGLLTVLHQDVPMDLDPGTPGVQSSRRVTLKPGRNVERVRVPALSSAGVHQFRAVFEAPNVTVETPGAAPRAIGDTLAGNNAATAFTFVRGKGKVLYIDNVAGGRGRMLRDALTREGIVTDAERTGIDQFPTSLVELQNYDAVILANVPRGAGGLSEDQQRLLASYVHDLGGGLIMIGGPDALGAGGWRGSKLEEILPVDLDVPAQRQIAKGALALVMHSCEMPQGNYWGEQCAIKAVETLSSRDDVGVISYGWRGGPGAAGGGSQWDFPLAPRGDGSKVIAAIKQMQLGDMPDFDDALELALNNSRDGTAAPGGLVASDARQKHVIIISDGDPSPPRGELIQLARDNRITISTVTVYPHMGDADGLPPVMKEIAEATGGRAYGPIDKNPNQLPQIFIKEATIVRRSLIYEKADGIPVSPPRTASDAVKGFASFPQIYGMVLTTKKNSPQVDMPLTAGENNDPLLAHWRAGLGSAAVFTADAHDRWSADWLSGGGFGPFWAQVVRVVARPAESSDFDVQVTQQGGRGRIVVEALDRDNAFRNFLNMQGTVVGPDGKPQEVRLVQIAPGTYAADFVAQRPGNYVVGVAYTGPGGQSGQMRSGTVVNASPELRELKSNMAALQRIADATGGRVLTPFDATTADLFSREGLAPRSSPQPWWDRLIPWLLALIIVDVAVRRIAWSWEGTVALAQRASQFVRAWTLSGKVESGATLDALRRKREEVAETKLKAPERVGAKDTPDPTRKFESRGVEGDTSQVLGGATDKPIPAPPKEPKPKGPQTPASEGSTTESLLEAKRRARKRMDEEQGQ